MLFEYEHDANLTDSERAAIARCCRLAAMPAFERLSTGDFGKLLEIEGFKDMKMLDLTDHIMPMFRAFARIAFVPYFMLRVLHREERLVSALSAVELWQIRRVLHYRVYAAVKPMGQ